MTYDFTKTNISEIPSDIKISKPEEFLIDSFGSKNRSFLHERFSRLSFIEKRGQLGLTLLDLDKFKLYNDGLGHLSGDGLLHFVSQNLEKICREFSSTQKKHELFHISGDEYVILSTGNYSLKDVKEIGLNLNSLVYEEYFQEEDCDYITLGQRDINASLGYQDGKFILSNLMDSFDKEEFINIINQKIRSELNFNLNEKNIVVKNLNNDYLGKIKLKAKNLNEDLKNFNVDPKCIEAIIGYLKKERIFELNLDILLSNKIANKSALGLVGMLKCADYNQGLAKLLGRSSLKYAENKAVLYRNNNIIELTPEKQIELEKKGRDEKEQMVKKGLRA